MKQMWPFDSMELARGQEDPIRGWVGHGPFDRRPTPVLLTARTTKAATFLTVFLVSDQGAEPATVAQRPVSGSATVVRELVLRADEASLTIEITPEGLLRLKEQ